MLACIDSESFITCEGWMFYIVITIFLYKKGTVLSTMRFIEN